MSTYTKLACVPVADLKPSPQHKYKMLEVLGEGCFGKVAKCCNRLTKELVALKVLKQAQNTTFYFQREVKMLDLIKDLEPDVFNIVEFIEHFEFDGQHCMAFEMLDKSVHDLLNQEFSFSLNEIRPMAKQLLTALLGLQSVGVLHSDIKPDNIMLVNHDKQPFKVKLIDFGVARHISEVRLGTIMQPIAYRAPEVTLGLPLSEAVDVWGLACCLMLWYLGRHDLKSFSEFDNLTMIVGILGLPANELLNKGIHTSKYFVQEDSKWRLKTLQEYKDSTGKDPEMCHDRDTTTLEELIKVPFEFQSNIERSDKEAFYDLLKKMLEMNPRKRITPVEALLHPFITMSHLPQGKCYTEVALQCMSVAETDFEPLQRESLEHIAEMFTQEREAARATRKLATPASNPANSQKAARRHTSEGSDINESGHIAISNSSGYLSTDEEESMGLSYEAGNGRWREKSPGEITIGSLYIPSGLHTIEEPASELVHKKISTLATSKSADSTFSSHEVTKWRDIYETGKSSFSSDFEVSSSSSGSLSENEENSFLSAGLGPSYTTKWRDINKTGKSSFSSDFQVSSSSSGSLSENEENSFLSAGLGPSYTTKWRDINKTGKSSFSSDFKVSSSSSGSLSENEENSFLSAGLGPSYTTKWRDINKTGKSSFSSDFQVSSSSSGSLSENEENSFLSAGLGPSYTTKWRDINKTGKSSFSSDFEVSSSSSGSLSENEENSFLLAGLGPSYTTKWRDINKTGKSSFSSDFKVSSSSSGSLSENEENSFLSAGLGPSYTTKWRDINKTGKSSFSSDFEVSSSSSGSLSENEENSFLSAGLGPSYTTKWRDINKTGKSSFSSDFKVSSSSSGSLSENEENSFLSAGLGPSYTRCQGKSLGERIIGSPSTSSKLITTEEPANEEPFQRTMSQSQEEDANSKVTSLRDMAATFEVADSTFIEALLEIGEIQVFEEDSDLGLAAVLEATKEGLSVDCSEILENIKKLFQDGEATKAQIDEVKGKASKSVFDRLRALFSRLFTLLKPRPKNPFFSKPKWVKHFPLFTRKSTKSGLSRH